MARLCRVPRTTKRVLLRKRPIARVAVRGDRYGARHAHRDSPAPPDPVTPTEPGPRAVAAARARGSPPAAR